MGVGLVNQCRIGHFEKVQIDCFFNPRRRKIALHKNLPVPVAAVWLKHHKSAFSSFRE
jgi:hypothetical protein